MKERLILFTGEMVRAILDGRKTETRRPVKPQKYPFGTLATPDEVAAGFRGGTCAFSPPLGTIGDRLWVRETTCIAPRRFAEPDETCMTDSGGFRRYVSYKADGHSEDAMRDYNLKWTPSIHVPRWASRIDLEITPVRVERVQDITEEDAVKEGCHEAHLEHTEDCADENCALAGGLNDCFGYLVSARLEFKQLWQSIYGTWDANPWVFVYEFRRIKP